MIQQIYSYTYYLNTFSAQHIYLIYTYDLHTYTYFTHFQYNKVLTSTESTKCHQMAHLFTRFMGLPAGHLNWLTKSSLFESGPMARNLSKL